jgi:hypothetical protein
MKAFATQVSVTVDAPRAQAFGVIVPIDLPRIFKGFGPLPAVVGTRSQTGGWDAAGQTRTVLLSDDSQAQELLTAYEFPRRFAYTVGRFTGILRHFAKEAHGEWWFEPAPTGTSIRWRYAFVSRSFLTAPVVWLITKSLWRCYMERALQLSKAEVEASLPEARA